MQKMIAVIDCEFLPHKERGDFCPSHGFLELSCSSLPKQCSKQHGKVKMVGNHFIVLFSRCFTSLLPSSCPMQNEWAFLRNQFPWRLTL